MQVKYKPFFLLSFIYISPSLSISNTIETCINDVIYDNSCSSNYNKSEFKFNFSLNCSDLINYNKNLLEIQYITCPDIKRINSMQCINLYSVETMLHCFSEKVCGCYSTDNYNVVYFIVFIIVVIIMSISCFLCCIFNIYKCYRQYIAYNTSSIYNS